MADESFSTYALNVEMKSTVRAKTRQFSWGLLQGLLEAKLRSAAEGRGENKLE